MAMQLVHSATGTVVEAGAMLRPVTGGKAWRLDRISSTDSLGCSQIHPHLGRVHREFHPKAFGLHVEISVRVWADWATFRSALRGWLITLTGATGAGVVAWIVAHFGDALHLF